MGAIGLVGLKRVLILTAVGLGLASVAAVPALAAGPGLPRTYQVQAIDSPDPVAGGAFPSGFPSGGGLKNAGDLNRDGKDDLLMAQTAGSPNRDGQAYVISGADGSTIARIPAPDAGRPPGVTTGNDAQFGSPFVDRIGTNIPRPGLGAFPGFTDLASCRDAAVSPGGLCRDERIQPADGIPDILVGARGVDPRPGEVDKGRVYIFDGATFSLLKRIDMPVEDRMEVAGTTGFGRTVINPAGVPACAGNGGVGDCDVPTFGPQLDQRARSVEMGDMDGGGRPDIVVGASSISETPETAQPGSHCARNPGSPCRSAGRVYFYYGEDIVGSSPGEVLEGSPDGDVPGGSVRDASNVARETFTRIKNPDAQADDLTPTSPSDIFGNSMTPVGDVGTCKAPAPAPGQRCPRAQIQSDPDGKADVVPSAQRADLPLDNPRPDQGDAGAIYVVDGATGTILATFENPQPQEGAVFGAQGSQFAPGDLGDTTKPDVFMGAPNQDTETVTGAGRGWVLNGNILVGANSRVFSRLDDPTPVKSGNFGGSHAGVGDLVPGPATPANELLVGNAGGFYGVAPQREILTEVLFFNPLTERALQSIPDPAQQGGSAFGSDPVPLGDLNGDGFLDLAAASQYFDGQAGVDQGRIYILRSDNSPPPAFLAPPQGAGPTAPPPTTAPPAGPAAAPSSPGTFKAGACANTFRGTNDDDRLAGSKAGDLMFGFDGDDTIDALDGNDCLDGGKGDDRLTARSGNDRSAGRAGDDSLTGGSGNDRLFGGDGRDRILGNSGKDMLAGGDGPDLIGGGSGRDRLFGERGKDQLNAVDGRGGDLVDCGPGRDRAVIDRGDRVRGCEKVTRRGRRR